MKKNCNNIDRQLTFEIEENTISTSQQSGLDFLLQAVGSISSQSIKKGGKSLKKGKFRDNKLLKTKAFQM